MYGITFLVKNHQRFSLKYIHFKTSASNGMLLFVHWLRDSCSWHEIQLLRYSVRFSILYFEMPTFPCFFFFFYDFGQRGPSEAY